MATTKPTLDEIRAALPNSIGGDDLIVSPFYHLGRLTNALRDDPSAVISLEVINAALHEGAHAQRSLERARFALYEVA